MKERIVDEAGYCVRSVQGIVLRECSMHSTAPGDTENLGDQGPHESGIND